MPVTPQDDPNKPASFIDAAFTPQMSQTMNDATNGATDAMTAQVAPLQFGSTTAPAAIVPPPATTTTPPAEEPFTPPGPVTVSTTDERTQYQSGKHVDPTIQAGVQDARADQETAQAEATRIQAEAEAKNAAVEADRVAALEKIRAEKEKRDQERAKVAADHLQKIRDAQKEADDNSAPPEETIGTRAVQSIGIALGGFGKALGGNNDNTVQIIENNRAQRLNAWKAQYTRLQGKVSGQENAYAHFRQAGLDDDAATNASIMYLNDKFASIVKANLAASKAPLTLQQGSVALNAMRESDLQADQALQMNAQGTASRIVDNKSKTTEGGADIEGRGKLLKQVAEDEHIKKYRAVDGAYTRFQDLVKGGADGAALTDFVAGKGGLDQGSFGPTMLAIIKKRGWFGEGLENLRSAWEGGVDPALLKEISTGLAIDRERFKQKAGASVRYFSNEFKKAGIPPAMILGSESSADAAADAGAQPSAYQGKK